MQLARSACGVSLRQPAAGRSSTRGVQATVTQAQFQQPCPAAGSLRQPAARLSAGTLLQPRPAFLCASRRTRDSRVKSGERNDGLTDDAGVPGFDPMEELGIPRDQRPVNELKALRESTMYNWALLEPTQLALRVFGLWGFFFAFIGGPISNVTFDPSRQPLEFALAGSAGALVPVVVALVRVYLGWAYVGNRLLSAVVEYEETGWYDGQMWVKPPKVLARDRLLGSYEVKPTLNRLKGTLLASAGILAAASVGLATATDAGKDADGMYGRSAGPRVVPDGLVFRAANVVPGSAADTEEGSLNEMNQLRYDDEAAAAEQKAILASQGEVPAYCSDRYFRAMAGGPVDCDAALERARAIKEAAAR